MKLKLEKLLFFMASFFEALPIFLLAVIMILASAIKD